MNDQLLMDNYLLVLKSTVEVYVHGTLESSNESVRVNLKKGLDKTLECQANTYQKMTTFGWYKINNCRKEEIQKTFNQLKSS